MVVFIRQVRRSHFTDDIVHRSDKRGLPAVACHRTRIVRKGASRTEQARQTRVRAEDPEEGDGGGAEPSRTHYQRTEDPRRDRFPLPVSFGVCVPNRRQAVLGNAVYRWRSALLPSPAGRSDSSLSSSVITFQRSERVSTRRK